MWTRRLVIVIVIMVTAALLTIEDTKASTYKSTLHPFNLKATNGYSIVKSTNGLLNKSATYDIYLSETVLSASNYEDLNRGLRKLTSNDTVIFHIANSGGLVNSGIQLIHAIKDSKALIKGIIEGPSYSIAAVLACVMDSLEVETYSFLMFHDYSMTIRGKGSESREAVKAIGYIFKKMLTNECIPKGILTSKQVKDISNGVDVYVFPQESR